VTLGDLQRRFTVLVGRLIAFADAQGYELTFGEAYRTPEQAAWDASHGTGIAHSEHCLRLAVDFNLFVEGKYQSTPAPYAPLGAFWKSQSDIANAIICCWGGDFATKDANHFSLQFQGVK